MQDSSYLSDQFLDRVRRSYRLCDRSDATTEGHIWMRIDKLRTSVRDALMDPDVAPLRAIFANPAISDLNYGFDRIARSLLSSLTTQEAQAEAEKAESERCERQIVRLAEALGLRRWLPPDSEHAPGYYPSDHDVSPDIDGLLNAVSREVAFDVQFPNPFPNEMGVKTSRGCASFRAVHAVYQAHRLVAELKGSASAAILEIGPGRGRTAYYARMAGLKNYTTVDLPLGVVAQACFLAATLGTDAIWMVGDNPAEAPGRIRLLPSTVALPEGERFALILNVDSLTEMDDAAAVGYCDYIEKHADIFLSVNHEVNNLTVAKLRGKMFSSARYSRMPYWMRNGYVEEIFRFN